MDEGTVKSVQWQPVAAASDSPATIDLTAGGVLDAATSRSSSRTTERIQSLEVLRVLAVFGIVWFHTDPGPGRQFGYAGLPVFIMLSMALILPSCGKYTFGEFVKRRADRLLIPWLFWSGVYLVPALAKCWYRGSTYDSLLSVSTILGGTWVHLWYLPFAFVGGVGVHWLQARTRALRPARLLAVVALVGALAVVGSSIALAVGVGKWPVPQWLFGAPAAVLGFALGTILGQQGRGKRVATTLLMLIVLPVLATCAALACVGCWQLVIPYSLGLILVSVALLIVKYRRAG